jgi:DNA-directed RNA polymerase subunit L
MNNGQEIVSNVNKGQILTFKMINVDVCVVNSLRRVILTEIPTLMFRGFPHYSNRINIKKNNTKFNNEYLKHRISCVPIHVNETEFENYKNNYEVRVSVVNTENKTIYVTTEDFKLFDKGKDTEIKEMDGKPIDIFKPDPISKNYIPICCLMPRISDTDDPEELTMVLDFDIGTAKEDACWNVVSKCMFVNIQDDAKIEEEIKRMDLKEDDAKDFRLLDAQRIFIPNQYLFTVESLGVYDNDYIVKKACQYIKIRLTELSTFLTREGGLTEPSFVKDKYGLFEEITSTTPMYYLRIENDDYTIGKLIEKYLYYMFGKDIYYVSFKKEHPHDTHCLIHFAYKNKEDIKVEVGTIIQNLITVIDAIIVIYNKIETI